MSNWVEIGNTKEIPNQDCKIIEINNIPIAIFNLDGNFYTIEDNCPHQHLPLADGPIEDNTITCPYHSAKFDIITGKVLSPPACSNLKTFPTRIIDDKIEIKF